MYLLFVDESGTHANSHAFVLGALAVHEDDAHVLQRTLDKLISESLGRVPVNLEEYELHAGEMRNAKKPKAKLPLPSASIWVSVPRQQRLAILESAYEAVAGFSPKDRLQPLHLFGVVLDPRFRSALSQVDRERYAYEVLLNKFDLMLKKLRVEDDRPNRGLVIHDRRVVAERDIQTWTTNWRAAAGDVGQLRNLADVPLFTDSRATRLLQVADLISYALYRRYSPKPDPSYFDVILPRFHGDHGKLHGLVHFTPDYGRGECECESCSARVDGP